jgi:exodeoxyribonuclease VII large subunit
VHAATSVGPGARLSIEFADGRVGATADADRPPTTSVPSSPAKAEPREARTIAAKRVTKPIDQGSLF